MNIIKNILVAVYCGYILALVLIGQCVLAGAASSLQLRICCQRNRMDFFVVNMGEPFPVKSFGLK